MLSQVGMYAKRMLFTLVTFLMLLGGLAIASRRPHVEQRPQISAQELPREWVWKKKTIDFDDMYRR